MISKENIYAFAYFCAAYHNFQSLNLPLFIAKRIAQNKQASFSKFVLRLATIATALSVTVMVVAVCVVLGFKTKIRDKMFVFWGHAQVTLFQPDPSNMVGDAPFIKDEGLIQKIRKTEGVTAVYPYVLKAAIIKAEKGLEGLKLKGIEPGYPLESSDAIHFEGQPISFSRESYSNDIILSQATLNRLELSIGNAVIVYFFRADQSAPIVRKLNIVGTYHTGMEEVDKTFAFCDAQLLRSVNGWSNLDISAMQIAVKDYRKAEDIAHHIYKEHLNPPQSIATIKDIYPFIFSWLDFQNVNAALILIIMAVVAAINMATGLLIYILERTSMIGILKTLGMSHSNIQRIFLYQAAVIAIKGIIWGNAIGLALCLIQQYYPILQLDETVYYMKAAPVLIDWPSILLIDLGTFVFCVLLMMLPALIVRSINIVQALRFK